MLSCNATCAAAYAVGAKWPGVSAVKVLDLKEGEECVIMGTLYKEMVGLAPFTTSYNSFCCQNTNR